jgi:CHASE3 domain sensor protein
MIRNTALHVGFAVLFALIVWNGYVVVSHTKHMQRSAALTARSSVVRAKISAVQKDLTDMQAGQRAYLISPDPSYLQRYADAKERIATDFGNLRQELVNRSEQERSLESEIESLVNSKQSEMERSLALRKQGYRHRAFKMVDSSEVMDYLDQARERVPALIAAEDSIVAGIENEKAAGLAKLLKETIIFNLALLVLACGLFVLVRYHARVLEQKAAERAQRLASLDSQLAKFTSALSNEARSKTSAIEANAHLLLQEYGGFLPRHAHECAEQIEEASLQLEQLRQDLIGDSHSGNEEGAIYEAVA